ncbi:hypothetical protein BK120_25530 [Paenibacillus sp. FSL A5-0031]|uniref:S-layer homology domain-containing protein n=1 Tax=Paenibacillus sp. FSL A5-0031 TaxID=1920420 RepID=UPI00096E4712|nr:S-layer homology domain-containing protein [Paenibacillus sp. FSL A5-0031]OME77638.1 hypothetical protein BK120_25530 [Paenibacillus sp. FSL A5-0031]
MQSAIKHRFILIVMAFLLAMMSVPQVMTVTSAAESNRVLLQEDFEGTDNLPWTSVSGTWNKVNEESVELFFEDFENENAVRWANNAGSWSSVQNGSSHSYKQSNDNNASDLITGDASWSDYFLEADVKLISGTGAMLKFRYMDGQHYYFLYMSDNYIKIMKQDGSNQVWLKQYNGPSLSPSNFVRIKVETTGNQIKVYREGEEVLSTTDEDGSDPYLTGKIGLATWATVVEFDNIKVTKPASNQVYSQLDANGGESYAGDNAWSSYSMQALVRPTAIEETSTVGISLRRQDNGDGYVMRYNGNGNIQIVKKEGENEAILAEAPYQIEPGKSYTLKGVAGGNDLELYINASKLLSAVDNTFSTGHISLLATAATASFDNVVVTRIAMPVVSPGNTTYYVSSSTGDDDNDGLSEAAAWKTLSFVNAATFLPGDRILLKSGDSWNEQLILRGSGTEEEPIQITSYGTGNKPVISWNAPTGGGVVTGYNLSHWLIQGLAVEAIPSATLSWGNITNGIIVQYDNSRLHTGLTIDGNEVYSSSPNTNTNGIVISSHVPGTDYKEVAKDIVISNNDVHDLGWYGITTSGWDIAKQEELRSQLTYDNLNVLSNKVYNMGSQGIVVQNAHNSAIQWNVVHDGGQASSDYGPGGLWYISSRDSVIRFNEVYNMKDSSSGYDGAGINIDWYCDNITAEYNYAHDNKGNGFTTMSNYGSKILSNKVKGNKGEQGNGRGQIALGSFTGRPDLSTGLHDIEVAKNTIIVDVEGTSGINSASNPYGTWTGNSIHDNNIVLKAGVPNTSVFNIGNDTLLDVMNNNRVFSEQADFRASLYGTAYTSLASWQAGTNYDQQSQVHALDTASPMLVQNVMATFTNDVQLTWPAAADQGGTIAHYNVYRSTTAEFTPSYANMIGESEQTSFTDRERVQSNTIYYYKVEAEDQSGNTGAASAPAAVTTGTVLSAPVNYKKVDFTILRDGNQLSVADLPVVPFLAGFTNIQKVELYVDDVKVQEMTTHPYATTVTGLSNGEHRLKYRVYEQSGAVTESSVARIVKQVNALRSVLTTNSPTIDGNLADWSSPDFRMDQLAQVRGIVSGFEEGWSAQKLSGAGYTRWDHDNLYFAMEVTEDQHNLPITDAADLWKGSSIQLAIDPQRNSAPGAKGYTELAFGLTNEGQMLGYRYNAVAGRAAGPFTAGSFVITRDEATKKTSYEIAIPWTELLPEGVSIQAGSALGLSALANYSDGTRPTSGNSDARNGLIEYNSGIGSVKDPVQFGYLILGEQPFTMSNLSHTISNQKVKLNWSAAAGATGYSVQYGTQSGVYTKQLNAGNVTEFNVAGLAAGTYYFVVKAYNSYGESHLSQELSVVVPSDSGNGNGNGNGNPNPSIEPESSIVRTVQMKDGVAYAELGADHKKAVILLSSVSSAPLRVQRDNASVTISKEIWDALKAQAGNAAGASVEVLLNPIALSEQAPLTTGKQNVQLKAAGSQYEVGIYLLTADKRTAVTEQGSKGVTLSLPYNSGEVDQELIGIYTYDEAAKQWKYVGGKVSRANKQVNFAMDKLGTYAVLEYKKAFTDVPSGHWAALTLQILAAKHIINGTTDLLFYPERKTTRAEFAALLVAALQLKTDGAKSTFDDVASDAWYADSIAAAVKAGIVSGRGSNRFAPNETITRAEMAVMAVRALGQSIKEGSNSSFADKDQIPTWALPYVAAASEASLMKGLGNNRFAPVREASRAEAAQLVLNLFNNLEGN